MSESVIKIPLDKKANKYGVYTTDGAYHYLALMTLKKRTDRPQFIEVKHLQERIGFFVTPKEFAKFIMSVVQTVPEVQYYFLKETLGVRGRYMMDELIDFLIKITEERSQDVVDVFGTQYVDDLRNYKGRILLLVSYLKMIQGEPENVLERKT